MCASRVLIGCAIAVSLAFSVAADEQNLLYNGSFDVGPDPWPLYDNAKMQVSFRDDLGSPLTGGSGPGSIQVRTTFWSGSASGTTQTVEMTGGGDYQVEASVFRPTEDNSAAAAFVTIELFDVSNKLVDTLQLTDTSVMGEWKRSEWDHHRARRGGERATVVGRQNLV